MDERDALLAQFDYWLDKEGIALPAERRLAALADFADVRRHVEIVDRSTPSDAEPAVVYLLRPGVSRA